MLSFEELLNKPLPAKQAMRITVNEKDWSEYAQFREGAFLLKTQEDIPQKAKSLAILSQAPFTRGQEAFASFVAKCMIDEPYPLEGVNAFIINAIMDNYQFYCPSLDRHYFFNRIPKEILLMFNKYHTLIPPITSGELREKTLKYESREWTKKEKMEREYLYLEILGEIRDDILDNNIFVTYDIVRELPHIPL